ncbi:hypothetical protein [Sutcliffiella horikoshii]|uniref:hypothetical protein n=1 Tax=Sutcliffiella horikoshii TaxID=79883 RepID=UPI0038502D0F
MTIENIRKQIQEADKLRTDLASNYRLQFREPLRNQISEIRGNRDYTPSGKDKLIEAARKRESRKLLQFAQRQRQQYAELLQKARKEAEAVVHANTPAVDAELEQRFSKRLREVKTEIMLSDAKKGKQLLTEFLAETGDKPAFAAKVKDEYAELIQPIINSAGQDLPKYRAELFHMFEDVKVKSRIPEAGEAQDLFEMADAMLQAKFFDQAMENVVGADYGQEAKVYVNDPDKYFELYPTDAEEVPKLKTKPEIFAEYEAKQH